MPSDHLRPGATCRRGAPLLLAGLLLTAGCTSGTPAGEPERLRAAPPAAPHGTGHAPTTTQPGAVPVQQAAPADPAALLRGTLQQLLGAHVLLADELVRATVRGQADQAAAAQGEVDRNSQALVEAVTSLAGAPAGQGFAAAWANHVAVLLAYATALGAEDVAGAQAARASYADAEARLADAFAALVGGTVPKAALTAAATTHGEHLLDQADAFAGGRLDEAYAIQREAFAHMIAAADVLARGVATSKRLPTAQLDVPRRTLQTAFSQLLAEHMGLMVQTMRAAHDDAPDFAAAGRSLNANTTDLGAAIGTLYGPDASRQFLALWAQHIEGLVLYATSPDDEAAQERARAAQVDYAPELARFLATATSQRLPSIELAAALTVHDDQLLGQADAHDAGDHVQAQRVSQEGYVHMFALSQRLAEAIGDAVAAKLPQGGPATGGGGLAGLG